MNLKQQQNYTLSHFKSYGLMLLCCLAKASPPPVETQSSQHFYTWMTNWSSSPPSFPLLSLSLCSTSLGSLHFPWQRDKGQAASPTQGCQSQASSHWPPPCSPARGFLHWPKGHHREDIEARNGRMKTWKRNVAKDNKRQEWLRRIEKESGESSAEKKRKIVCEVERRELRKRGLTVDY